jgi:polysaccharide pyruvyl transferase WcaK-like protein
MLTVFVAEIVPSLNKGEAALMHGIMRSIKQFAEDDVQFYLCSESQYEDQKEYGQDVKVIDDYGLVPVGGSSSSKLARFSVKAAQHLLFLCFYTLLGRHSLKVFRSELWRAYAEADVIVVGHDNAFSKFHIPLMFYSKLLGKKAVVYGATIMPKVLNSSFLRKLAAVALNKMDLITCREPLTYKHLQDIGVNKAPLYYTADKAFILDSENTVNVEKLVESLDMGSLAKPLIGVMIVKGSTVFKAAFKDQDLTAQAKYDKHIGEIAAALDLVQQSMGGTFFFIPHCIGPGENLDDRICARDVKACMTSASDVVLLEDELRVTELKALLGELDLVISERTHGGINASTMYTPTLWITHPGDHRTYGIVSDTLDLPQCLYNIEDLNSVALSDKIIDIWGSRSDVVETLERTVPLAYDASMSNGKYFKDHVINS